MENEKKTDDIINANNEISLLNQERQNQTIELQEAYKAIVLQIEEKEKRAAELAIANAELIFQNQEKEKRAAELAVANAEILFLHQENYKRAAELRLKESEDIILKNEKRFRALIESSTDMITLASKEGKLHYSSPSFSRMFGYTYEEICQKSAGDIIHPDDFTTFAASRLKLLECSGDSFHCQLRM